MVMLTTDAWTQGTRAGYENPNLVEQSVKTVFGVYGPGRTYPTYMGAVEGGDIYKDVEQARLLLRKELTKQRELGNVPRVERQKAWEAKQKREKESAEQP